MAGVAYPKRAVQQNRTSSRSKATGPKTVRAGDIDYTFLFIVILLLAFGLVMLLSASAPAANRIYNNSYYFFFKQFACAAAGLVGMYFVSKIHIIHLHQSLCSYAQ